MKDEAMTDDAAPTIIRRTRLLQDIVDRGFLRVTDASGELGVSAVTVRSDLAALELAGSIVRVHGGAMPRGVVPDRESSFEKSLAQESSAKAAIGRRAAGLVSSGDSVLLDVGTTALAVAHALVARRDLSDVVVVTNGLSIALALEPALPRFEVIVTGGTLRPLQHSLVEPLASEVLERIRADVVFVGCTGVHPEAGVTNVNLPEATLKRRMLHAATRRVVVADSSKLGVVDLGRVAGADEFDRLLTGAAAGDAVVERLEAAGLAVTRCGTLRPGPQADGGAGP